MLVVAIPNPTLPPTADSLAMADLVLPSIERLVPSTLEAAAATAGKQRATCQDG
jgi:hypothetical protein